MFTMLKEKNSFQILRYVGKKWFVITNPMYGRWEYSIYDNESPESEEAATAIRKIHFAPKIMKRL